MADDETVRIHVSISIEVDEHVDTGVSVEAWNVMDPAARTAMVEEIWREAAQADNGGISVVTAGAASV